MATFGAPPIPKPAQDDEEEKFRLGRSYAGESKLGSKMGWRKHPIFEKYMQHTGNDHKVAKGTPILAAFDGIVTEIKRSNTGYGNRIRIKDKRTGRYVTLYAHLDGFAKGITEGSEVSAGQVVAFSGSSGRSTGPHLHEEFFVDGKRVNPEHYRDGSPTLTAGDIPQMATNPASRLTRPTGFADAAQAFAHPLGAREKKEGGDRYSAAPPRLHTYTPYTLRPTTTLAGPPETGEADPSLAPERVAQVGPRLRKGTFSTLLRREDDEDDYLV